MTSIEQISIHAVKLGERQTREVLEISSITSTHFILKARSHLHDKHLSLARKLLILKSKRRLSCRLRQEFGWHLSNSIGHLSKSPSEDIIIFSSPCSNLLISVVASLRSNGKPSDMVNASMHVVRRMYNKGRSIKVPHLLSVQ